MFEAITASTAALNKAQLDLVRGQQEQGNDIAELKKQIGDLVKQMNQNQGQGRLLAGTIPDPTFDEAKVITTWSGEVFEQTVLVHEVQEEQEVVDILKSQVQEDPETSGKSEDGKTHSQPGQTSDPMDIHPTSVESAHTIGIATLTSDPIDMGIATNLTDPKAKNGEKGKLSNSSSSVLANYLSSMPFPNRFDTSRKEASGKKIHENEQTIGDAIKQVPKPTLELNGEKAKFNVSDKKPPPVPIEKVASIKEVVVANHEPPDRFVVGQLGSTNMHVKEAFIPPKMIIEISEWIDRILEDFKSAGHKRKTCHGELLGLLVEYHPFFEAGIT